MSWFWPAFHKIIVLFPLSHILCARKIFIDQSTSRECINQALLRLYKNIFCSLFDLLCNDHFYSLFTSLDLALERNIPMQYNNHALYTLFFISYLKSTRLYAIKRNFLLGFFPFIYSNVKRYASTNKKMIISVEFLCVHVW